jgi:glutathione synthase/RimK-type ligase-like ATP-grasp enzyme
MALAPPAMAGGPSPGRLNPEHREAPVPRPVLIVTSGDDLHADLVAARIESEGGVVFRLDLDVYPADYALGYGFSGGRWEGRLRHLPSGHSLRLDEVGAVWMRKRAPFRYPSGPLTGHEKAHADAETDHILLGLLRTLDCYWMSHPDALRGSVWKPEQLQRAARMGFAVPPSLVTNSRSHVEAFRATAGQGIVFKALSPLSTAAQDVPPDQRIAGGVPTTRIGDEHGELLDAVAELPCFFQHYVPKRHELRVTVVGDTLFAARIHSQDDPRTATDWRDMSAEIRFEAAELPPDVAQRCHGFVRSYGLAFGALDLIVTPEGEHVFLENNPVGQFLFVEQLVPELDMTGAVARCLVAGAAGKRSAP